MAVREDFIKSLCRRRLAKTLTRCLVHPKWDQSPPIVWAFQCEAGGDPFIVGSTVTMDAVKVRGWDDFDMYELPRNARNPSEPQHFVIGTKAWVASARSAHSE